MPAIVYRIERMESGEVKAWWHFDDVKGVRYQMHHYSNNRAVVRFSVGGNTIGERVLAWSILTHHFRCLHPERVKALYERFALNILAVHGLFAGNRFEITNQEIDAWILKTEANLESPTTAVATVEVGT